jgi:uncharacterized protein
MPYLPASNPPFEPISRRQWLKATGAASSLALLPSLGSAQSGNDFFTISPGREVLGLGKPQHACIVPTANGNFAWANQALKAGLLAAHQRDGRQFPLLLAECDDKPADLAKLVAELQAQGIGWLMGPVTRNGVNSLIDSGATSIPTLTLNLPDVDRVPPRNWFLYGLAAEAEARQVATWAYDETNLKFPDRRPLRAFAITQPTAAARRGAGSFVETWRSFNGEAMLPLELEGRPVPEIRALIDAAEPDAVFISCSLDYVKNLRGAFEKKWALYGTSSLSNSAQPSFKSMPDLDGVRVVDMPWMTQADHPAVMTYARPPARYNAEMLRLFALAIDAYRLSFDTLLDVNRTELDGVTGRLIINRKAGRVDRLGNTLVYRNGVLAAS